MLARFSVIAVALSLMFSPGLATASPFGLSLNPSATVVNSGDVVTVDLIFTDLNPGAPPALASEGIASGGGRILLDNTSSASVALTGGAADIMPNAAFDFSIKYPFDAAFPNGPPADFINLAGFIGLDIDIIPLGLGQNQVLLGQFQLTVLGSARSQAILSPALLGAGFDTNVGGLLTQYDPLTTTFEGATIQIVPEPSSLLIWASGIAVFAIARRHWRRHSKRKY